jgi:hypothetical protein
MVNGPVAKILSQRGKRGMGSAAIGARGIIPKIKGLTRGFIKT